jgi:hypothetical protein
VYLKEHRPRALIAFVRTARTVQTKSKRTSADACHTPCQHAPALQADAAGLETPREGRRRGTRSNSEALASSRPTRRRRVERQRVERQLQPRMQGSARQDADNGVCNQRCEEEQEEQDMVHVLHLSLLAYRSTGGHTRGGRAHVVDVIHVDADAGGTLAATGAAAASRAWASRAWAVQSLGGRQPAAVLAGAASTRNVAEVAELRPSDTTQDADGESRAKVLCAGAAAASRDWAAASNAAALRAQQAEQWVRQYSVVASDTICSSPPLSVLSVHAAAHQNTRATAGASCASTSPAGSDALASAPPTSERGGPSQRGVPAYILRRAASFKFKQER